MNTVELSDSDRAFNVFRFQRAMRHVGRLEPEERGHIANLAAHAVMTGDKFLAAAIMSQLGAMPKRERWLAIVLRQELESVILDGHAGRAWEAIGIARARACSSGPKPQAGRSPT